MFIPAETLERETVFLSLPAIELIMPLVIEMEKGEGGRFKITLALRLRGKEWYFSDIGTASTLEEAEEKLREISKILFGLPDEIRDAFTLKSEPLECEDVFQKIAQKNGKKPTSEEHNHDTEILEKDGEPYALITEVSKELGVSLSTLYRAIKSGKIRSITLNRRRLINLEDTRKWYASWEQQRKQK